MGGCHFYTFIAFSCKVTVENGNVFLGSPNFEYFCGIFDIPEVFLGWVG